MEGIKKAWERIKLAANIPTRHHFPIPAKYLPPPPSASAKRGVGNVIDGHDYTHAEFIEIEPAHKDTVFPTLSEIHRASLIVLTVPRKGPGGKYRGIGWMDLFAERTYWDKLIWPHMELIRNMARYSAVNEDCMFRLWFCPPGLLHIEVDDDGTWSTQDILSLPDWMLMG